MEQERIQKLAARMLQQVEALLETQPLDVQKCKHITGILKDLRDLQQEEGPGQILVMFDPETEEAAK